MLGNALISVALYARSLSKFQQDKSTRERLLNSKTTYVDSRTQLFHHLLEQSSQKSTHIQGGRHLSGKQVYIILLYYGANA